MDGWWRSFYLLSHLTHMTSHAQVISIGIDVSQAKLDVCLLGTASVVERRTIGNDQSGIASLIALLSRASVAPSVPCILESTGDLHLLAALLLSQAGYHAIVINPLITKCHQQSSVRGAKNDRIDAERLANIALMEKHLIPFRDTVTSIGQKKIIGLLRNVSEVHAQLTKVYRQFQKTSAILSLPHGQIKSIEDSIKSTAQTIKTLQQMITASAPQQAVALAEETPGLSLMQITIILTALSEKTFQNRDQLVAFFGLDVRVRQSGTWRGKESLSKRGDSYCRKILFQIGWSLMRNNSTYKTYFEHHYKELGKHYTAAILATSRKFLRFLFSTLYQPSPQLASLSA